MEEEGLTRRYSNANFRRPLSFFRNVENLLRSPTTLCLNSFPFSLTFERVDPGAVQREYVGEGAGCSGRPAAEAGAEAEAAGVVLPAPRQLRRGVTNCERKILRNINLCIANNLKGNGQTPTLTSFDAKVAEALPSTPPDFPSSDPVQNGGSVRPPVQALFFLVRGVLLLRALELELTPVPISRRGDEKRGKGRLETNFERGESSFFLSPSVIYQKPFAKFWKL